MDRQSSYGLGDGAARGSTPPPAGVVARSGIADPSGALVSAAAWHATLAPPVTTFSVAGRFGASVSVYSGTSPDMKPPPLSDNILVMHLGGSKRVHRAHGGGSTLHDVALGGLTVMPAMEQDRWSTSGPIEFAHLVLSTALVAQIAMEEFDTEARDLTLLRQVGARIPLVEQAFRSLISLSNGQDCGRLYPESLLIVLLLALLREQSKLTGGSSADLARKGLYRGGLAGWQLRRVMDFMAENFAEDVALSDLTTLVGLSRAQFFRSFKQSTGLTPHAALTRLRLDQARSLFEQTSLGLDEIAAAVGLGSARFAALFKEQVGISPRLYRSSLG